MEGGTKLSLSLTALMAYKLPNGNLLVPEAEDDRLKLMGIGMVEVEPSTVEYEEWLPVAGSREDWVLAWIPDEGEREAVLAYLTFPHRLAVEALERDMLLTLRLTDEERRALADNCDRLRQFAENGAGRRAWMSPKKWRGDRTTR